MTAYDMFSFGYRDRKWRMIKDICFILVGILLIWRGRFFGALLGVAALSWYGYDLYLQLKLRKAEKEQEAAASAPQQTTPADEGRITITDLSDAKEVKFEKE